MYFILCIWKYYSRLSKLFLAQEIHPPSGGNKYLKIYHFLGINYKLGTSLVLYVLISKFCNNKVDIITPPFYTGSWRYLISYTPENIINMWSTIIEIGIKWRSYSICFCTPPCLTPPKCSIGGCWVTRWEAITKPCQGWDREGFKGKVRVGMSPRTWGNAGWCKLIMLLHSLCQCLKGPATWS